MRELTGLESFEEVVRIKRNAHVHSVGVSRRTLHRMIERFNSQQIDADELSNIAEALELADEVTYELGHEKEIADVLFELSSPEANGPITLSKCANLLVQLG